ncbi:hypothetical protein IGS74_17440 [Aureimonas sp. OT7]|nr:hypothetical protein [Aureimonas altamirensis]QOG06295.1 hypothetical protein IGS74_17440 [Aureimonas sp. OT7]
MLTNSKTQSTDTVRRPRSVMQMSAIQRLGIVAAPLLLLWAAVLLVMVR